MWCIVKNTLFSGRIRGQLRTFGQMVRYDRHVAHTTHILFWGGCILLALLCWHGWFDICSILCKGSYHNEVKRAVTSRDLEQRENGLAGFEYYDRDIYESAKHLQTNRKKIPSFSQTLFHICKKRCLSTPCLSRSGFRGSPPRTCLSEVFNAIKPADLDVFQKQALFDTLNDLLEHHQPEKVRSQLIRLFSHRHQSKRGALHPQGIKRLKS